MRLPYEYKEQAPYETGFAEYYKEHIVPLAEVLEPQKRRIEKEWPFRVISAVLCSIGALILLIKKGLFLLKARKGGGLLVAIPASFWWWFVRRPREKFFVAQKVKVLPKIVSFCGNFNYKLEDDIQRKALIRELASHAIFKKCLYIKLQDWITGKKDGASIEIVEAEMHSRKGQEFRGVIILLTFPFRFEQELVLTNHKKRIIHYLQGRRMKRRNSRLSEIEMLNINDAVFKRVFCAYTTSPEFTRQVLTGTFRAELLKLNHAFNREGMECSIKGDTMMVALTTDHNMFEVGTVMDRPIVNAEDIKRVLAEIHTSITIAAMLQAHMQEYKK